MTELEYLDKNPFDVTFGTDVEGTARIRLFVCPEDKDHPVLRMNAPADCPDEESVLIPHSSLGDVASHLFRMVSTIYESEGPKRRLYCSGALTMIEAFTKYLREMETALTRMELN